MWGFVVGLLSLLLAEYSCIIFADNTTLRLNKKADCQVY